MAAPLRGRIGAKPLLLFFFLHLKKSFVLIVYMFIFKHASMPMSIGCLLMKTYERERGVGTERSLTDSAKVSRFILLADFFVCLLSFL